MDDTEGSAQEVSVRIDAAPARVWELIGDPTRMGEWSPECNRVTWSGGEGSPRVGAKFKGHNRLGWRRWTTTGTIVAFDPEREIGWDVDFATGGSVKWLCGGPGAGWLYVPDDLEPGGRAPGSSGWLTP